MSHGSLGAATGQVNVQVSLANRSASACWLDGHPTISGVAANGNVAPLHAKLGSFLGNPGPSADIANGQSAAVNISGYDGCAAAQAGAHYYLNCAGASAIPAHGSVTYQMRLALPADLAAGTGLKLDWQVQGGGGPAAASLTVEP